MTFSPQQRGLIGRSALAILVVLCSATQARADDPQMGLTGYVATGIVGILATAGIVASVQFLFGRVARRVDRDDETREKVLTMTAKTEHRGSPSDDVLRAVLDMANRMTAGTAAATAAMTESTAATTAAMLRNTEAVGGIQVHLERMDGRITEALRNHERRIDAIEQQVNDRVSQREMTQAVGAAVATCRLAHGMAKAV